MQEEVENRTVNIVVMTTRLTARSMIDGLRKYMNEQSQMKQHARQKKQDVKLESKYRQKEQRKAEGPHGKQTVRQLVQSTRKQLEKGDAPKKPSVLTALKKAKELVAATPAKTRQKEKDLSL